MLRTGIDLVEVDRLARAVARYGERFLTRVFTEHELAYAAGRTETLAGRFAAKEAVSKLLGVGIQHRMGVGWRDIEVHSSHNGDPSLQLTGAAARRAEELGLSEFSISLSHTSGLAIAIVVAQ